MKSERRISLNAMPGYVNAILLALMFVGATLISSSLDRDFYFLYSFGRAIVQDGFPVKDVLSMHGEMDIIVQQWLTDVLFYRAYDLAGRAGVIAIVYAVWAAYTAMMYKLCRLITENFALSVVSTLLSSVLMALFMVTRPQIFTYLNFVLLLYFLEKYVRTRKVRWLCLLPVLSCVQINLHASMWLMLFVLMMPYVVSCVNIRLPLWKESAKCRIVPLALTMAVMVAAALLNPYGHKALLYLFGSYGVENINNSIQEMQAVSISDSSGKLYLGIVFAMIALVMLCRRRKAELRFICLGLGTMVLGLTSYKANAYFYIVGFAVMAHYFRDVEWSLKITEGTRSSREKVRLAVLVLLVVLAAGYLFVGPKPEQEEDDGEKVEQLEPAADYLDTQDRENMVLYAGFNEGSYLEFRGYKPYMDGRAELFLEEKNGQFDYFSEYLKVTSGRIHYRDFLDKYGFTHIVVPTGENYLYVSIMRDSDYEVGYTDENFTVFVLKNPS